MSASTRPATPGDVKRFAAFLPMWKPIEGDEGLIAEANRPSRVVGCSLLGTRPGDDGLPLLYIDATVLPRFRDDGTLAQLLEPLLERAAHRGAAEVLLATPREPGSPDLAALEQLGFAKYRTLITYEFTLPEFVERSSAAYRNLRRRGTIPANVEVTGLLPAHWPAAVKMLRAEGLMNDLTQVEAEREGLDVHFSPASSMVVLDGKLLGVVLTHARGRQMETSALAVDPHFRGGVGWVNALLSWRVSEIAPAIGFETLTMAADPQRHPMTTRLAQRMNATKLLAKILLQKRLTSIANL